MFTKIGQILPKAVQKNGMAPKVAKAQVFAVFEETARRHLPASQGQAFKLLHLVGGTLTVACKSSPVAAKLRAIEPDLLEAVSQAGGGIEKMRFLLAPWR